MWIEVPFDLLSRRYPVSFFTSLTKNMRINLPDTETLKLVPDKDKGTSGDLVCFGEKKFIGIHKRLHLVPSFMVDFVQDPVNLSCWFY